MKKLIPILMAGLIACWSCDLKGSYTQTNVRDLVSFINGELVNDYGYRLNVVEDGVGAAKWQIEGARFYTVYDILSRDMDVRLKEMLRGQIAEASEDYNPDDYAKDPVELTVLSASGGYVNIALMTYRDKTSNHAHPIYFHYKMENKRILFYIEHDGDGEDPTQMDSDDLTTEVRLFCIPVEDLPEFTALTLTMNCIVTGSDGSLTVEETTVELR